MDKNKLLTTAELAEYFQISIKRLEYWRSQGKGPPWVRLEGSIRYRWDDVQKWLEGNQCG